MKVLINEIEIDNVLEYSTSNSIIAGITVEEALVVYNQAKELKKCDIKYIDNENVVGIYVDKYIKTFSYEQGVANFILADADTLLLQVQENTEIINAMLLSDLEEKGLLEESEEDSEEEEIDVQ